jgi:hypothetical protein
LLPFLSSHTHTSEKFRLETSVLVLSCPAFLVCATRGIATGVRSIGRVVHLAHCSGLGLRMTCVEGFTGRAYSSLGLSSIDRGPKELEKDVTFSFCHAIASRRIEALLSGMLTRSSTRRYCPDPLVLGSCVPAVGKNDRQSNQGPYQTASLS